ncbi:MAG: hypothetical protein ACTHOG_10825 [Marmoricola sp.]
MTLDPPILFEVNQPLTHLHGTKADLAVGDLVSPWRTSNVARSHGELHLVRSLGLPIRIGRTAPYRSKTSSLHGPMPSVWMRPTWSTSWLLHLTLADIRSARLRAGRTTDRLALDTHTGTQYKFLFPREDQAFRILRDQLWEREVAGYALD